jgi:hypothetical protein
MSRAEKLVHPATLFIQHLPYTEVAFKDMTPLQQRGLYDFMNCGGDGVWGENADNFEQALELYGDVRFGVGKFANDDTFKEAMLAASEDADDEVELESWFQNRYVCGDRDIQPEPPVILNHQDVAPENGIFEWGFGWFYSYWVHLPETEFVRFLPDWNPDDHTGRGGQ